jgi:hypothetical protein
VRRLATQLCDSLGERLQRCLPRLEDLTLTGELAPLLAGNVQQAMWRVVRGAGRRLRRLALHEMEGLTDSTAAMLLACRGVRELAVRHCCGVSGAALLQVGTLGHPLLPPLLLLLLLLLGSRARGCGGGRRAQPGPCLPLLQVVRGMPALQRLEVHADGQIFDFGNFRYEERWAPGMCTAPAYRWLQCAGGRGRGGAGVRRQGC